MKALRIRNRLEFIDLAERLAQIEAHPATRVPLPGRPFRKSDGAFVPLFQIRIHAKLRDNSS